ncbi:GLPGLI family protein [Chryseobacterium sp. A301]
MKKLLLLLALNLFSMAICQTHRFLYELNIKKNGYEEKTNMTLDIDKDFVKFYDYEFVLRDSINKATGQTSEAFSEIDQRLYRKAGSFENRNMFRQGYDYYAISSKDKMNWKIENEHKKVDGFELQKATLAFGERQWTAWFCPEIPFQEGPYKFRGLPGLIFEVYDSEDIFHYSMVKSENLAQTYDTHNFLETHYGKKPISITQKQFHTLKVDHFNNIVEVLNRHRENGVSIATEGELATKEEINKKRKSLQDNIKSYYLPIEKDRAIPYP